MYVGKLHPILICTCFWERGALGSSPCARMFLPSLPPTNLPSHHADMFPPLPLSSPTKPFTQTCFSPPPPHTQHASTIYVHIHLDWLINTFQSIYTAWTRIALDLWERELWSRFIYMERLCCKITNSSSTGVTPKRQAEEIIGDAQVRNGTFKWR